MNKNNGKEDGLTESGPNSNNDVRKSNSANITIKGSSSITAISSDSDGEHKRDDNLTESGSIESSNSNGDRCNITTVSSDGNSDKEIEDIVESGSIVSTNSNGNSGDQTSSLPNGGSKLGVGVSPPVQPTQSNIGTGGITGNTPENKQENDLPIYSGIITNTVFKDAIEGNQDDDSIFVYVCMACMVVVIVLLGIFIYLVENEITRLNS